MAKTIMIQGTCSNAGKSLLTAALCRIFRQDGYAVAPFKAQNMALNSYVTRDGLEMGRAQAVQAEAAGIIPDIRMNPILLKPSSDTGSQVIVNGVLRGDRTAQEYWKDKKALRPVIQAAYDSLAAAYDIIVIEGAGSPAEINLKQDDIVNMGMARMADAPVLLVGDIDRGGVFASLYGTVKLLEPEEQERIQGLIINKFRGDVALLRPGLRQLEELTGKPVLGVVPYTDLDIDGEDSLANDLPGSDAVPVQIEIAVMKLPHLSNATDFRPLSRIPGISVCYADETHSLTTPDLIILPGTKNTMSDLLWLRYNGLERQILRRHASGTPVLGICGGYQIMGSALQENKKKLSGMGLLPVDTVFSQEKLTVQVTGQIHTLSGPLAALSGLQTAGYEIHMGSTTRHQNAQPFQMLYRHTQVIQDGCQYQNAYGTYQHGLFDNASVTESLVRALAERKGISLPVTAGNLSQYKEAQYDQWAAVVRASLDMKKIYQILGGDL